MKNSNNQQTQQKKVHLIGDYIRQERIGRGSFASVYKAQHKTSNEIVAIKDIYIEKMPEKNLEQEISIMHTINHSSIVKLIDCIRTTSHVYLVMEYCSLGDLSTYMKEHSNGKGMSEPDLIHFLSQIASGLKYLRTRNFVHRDIKPQNILLVPGNTDNQLPNIKISDFGFAKFLPNADLTSSICGTPLYMAPEVFFHKSYNAKADLWSVGCLLYELMMGKKLFSTNELSELSRFLFNYDNELDFTGSNHFYSQELKDLISVLLKKDPADRASCEDFFHHVELIRSSKEAVPEQDVSDEDEDEEYVVVVDIQKRRNSSVDILADDLNNLSIEKKYYSSSAPPPYQPRSLYNSDNLLVTPLLIRERKFSVGSASSVLTKALSKASTKLFFGAGSTPSSSPPSPITPPSIQEEEEAEESQQTLVVEEVTHNKLLVSTTIVSARIAVTSQEEETITEDDLKFISNLEEMSRMIDTIESFADHKSKQADDMPFDIILAEEAVILYSKVLFLLQSQMDQIKSYAHKSKLINLKLKYMNQRMEQKIKSNKKISAFYIERCSEDDDDVIFKTGNSKHMVTIEQLLYDRALELSKEAAIKQLIEEDLQNCAEKYQKAIQLIQCIMITSTINSKDEKLLLNFIDKIKTRLEKVVTTTAAYGL